MPARAFDVTPATRVLGDAISLVGKLGTVALTSLGPVTDNQVVMPMFEMAAFQKRIIGELLLDELVTRTYPLEQVNQGYEDMRTHRNIRGMTRYP